MELSLRRGKKTEKLVLSTSRWTGGGSQSPIPVARGWGGGGVDSWQNSLMSQVWVTNQSLKCKKPFLGQEDRQTQKALLWGARKFFESVLGTMLQSQQIMIISNGLSKSSKMTLIQAINCYVPKCQRLNGLATDQRSSKPRFGKKKVSKSLLQKHEKRSHSHDRCNTLWTFSHLLVACQKGEPNNVIVQGMPQPIQLVS